MPTLNLGRVRPNWRGEYVSTTPYLEHDIVTADGQSYVCIADVTGTGPLDTGGSTYWDGALLRGADYNQARDDAVQAASDAEGSATSAATSENNASSSATTATNAATASETARDKSQDWAEGIEPEIGAKSAREWAEEAQNFGDPNEFDITADLTSDTRKLREWMAQALANQQAATDALARANHTGTQPLSTISDAGTAAAADVTTSATDTTAGRLLKTGAGQAQAYRQGSILGTVSQTNGIPTGAIIERGSNANGEYVKFADGTLECWKAVIFSGPAESTAEASIYQDYPHIFSANGDVVVLSQIYDHRAFDNDATAEEIGRSNIVTRSNTSDELTRFNGRLRAPNNTYRTDVTVIALSLKAVGRWI